MVTCEFEGVNHYYLNGDWFHPKESIIEVKDEKIFGVKHLEWIRGAYGKNEGECHQYEILILDMCLILERQKKMRQEYDCRELSLAVAALEDSINRLRDALEKYSPPEFKE
jgi:hypothetical protein